MKKNDKLNYDEEMSIEKALDYAIRDYECREETVKCGYELKREGRTYWNYMSNDAWNEFLNKMSRLHQAQFKEGDGDELNEKKGRYGWTPPKMASFGSSSRFIYNKSKDIEGFEFEKQLPTRVGHRPANIDGYIQRGNVCIYVEGKCREIYASHKAIKVSNVYLDIYDKLKENFSKFNYKNEGQIDDRHFMCSFSYDDKPLVHFDIKQLICHFLGISSYLLENKEANSNIKFIYLIFNPSSETCFENSKISSYKGKLERLYKETISEIPGFGDMKKLFDAIMKIQKERLDLPARDYSFEFRIASQEDYESMIRKQIQ